MIVVSDKDGGGIRALFAVSPREQRYQRALVDLRARLALTAKSTHLLSSLMVAETLTLMAVDIDKALEEEPGGCPSSDEVTRGTAG